MTYNPAPIAPAAAKPVPPLPPQPTYKKTEYTPKNDYQPAPSVANKTWAASEGMGMKGLLAVPSTFAELKQLCELLACSGMVPKAYITKPADIFVAIQLGSKFGWDPLFSLQNIGTVNGTPVVHSKGFRSLILGHPQFDGIEEIILKGNTPDTQGAQCTLKHKDSRIGSKTVSFTLADAEKAGLTSRDTYKSYPLVMCAHRAFTRCANALFPEATFGLAVSEIVEEEKQRQAAIKDVTPAQEPPKSGVEMLLETVGVSRHATYEEYEVLPQNMSFDVKSATPYSLEEKKQETDYQQLTLEDKEEGV